MRLSSKEEFRKVLSRIHPVDRFSKDIYLTGNESPVRACILKRMTKDQISDLHEREVKLNRVLASFVIARNYRISFHFVYTDREYVAVIEEINKQRPRKIEPRPCVECMANFKVCAEYRNGDCYSTYTDIEYRHAWDMNIFHNSPRDIFMKESSGKRLIDQVDDK